MRSLWVGWLVAVGLARTAAAQAPWQHLEPASPMVLEQRVPMALEREGVALARRGLQLHVDQVGDQWVVALADVRSGRVVRAVQVDVMLGEQDAAVMRVMRVVADMVAQIDRGDSLREPVQPYRPQAPPPGPPPPSDRPLLPPSGMSMSPRPAGPPDALGTWRYEGDAAYKQQALHLMPGSARRWLVVQGDAQTEIDPQQFYVQVGRQDLADSYGRRQGVMVGSFVVASAATIGAVALLASWPRGEEDCDPYEYGSTGYYDCFDQNLDAANNQLLAFLATSGLVAIAAVGFSMGGHYYRTPHPIELSQAKQLADAYNQRLRGRLQPVGAAASWLPKLTLAPVATGRDAGFAITARF